MADAAVLAELAAARSHLARASTAERVAGVLRDRISAGSLPPGTQVGELAVATALGVSRNTLREAFRLLDHERLLVHEPHRGVFVRTLAETDVVDIYRTRQVVEGGALQCASAGDRALGAVRAAVTAGERAAADGRWIDVGTADLQFHAAVTALAGSRHLDALMRRLLAELRLAFSVMGDPRGFHEPYLVRNAEIAAQLGAGLIEPARASLERYLDDAREQLLAEMRRRR
jgi:DNA-binding GntR family transcriptional regulator